MTHLFCEGVDGPVDKIRAVIGDNNLHPRRQARLDAFSDLFLDPVDDAEDILAEADHHDPARDLAPPVKLGKAAPDLRTELDAGNILEKDGGAVATAAHRDILQVLDALEISATAHHVFDPGELQHPAFHILVALADGIHDHGNGQVVGLEAVGIDAHLILPDKAADAGNLGDPGHAFQGQLDVPVLNGAEVSKIVPSGFIHQGIGKSPAYAGGIGPEHGIHRGRELVLHRLEIFQHPASGPVDVGPFLEDGIDERGAEKGEPAHHLDLGRGKQGGGDRVGDLVFDKVGAAAFPFGEDDDLGVAQIGDRIKGRVADGPDPPAGEGKHQQEDEKPVAGAEIDNAGDHCFTTPLRRASESMRKVAAEATFSPVCKPLMISAMPSALTPTPTSRGSK